MASLNAMSIELPNIILNSNLVMPELDILMIAKAGLVAFFYQYVLLGLMAGFLGAAYDTLKGDT